MMVHTGSPDTSLSRAVIMLVPFPFAHLWSLINARVGRNRCTARRGFLLLVRLLALVGGICAATVLPAQGDDAPKTRPNVVMILLDDVGFGAASGFGGLVPMPTLDGLAREGLRFNTFHTTAICSPTRAALLTGRNHHRVNFGGLTEGAGETPGYTGRWPAETASVARVLRMNGYGTAAFGKWHNTRYDEISPSGPFDRWPTGLGFDHFYGFMGGETSQWEPQLYDGTTPVEPPSRPEQGYHLTTDMVDHAISWMTLQRALKPENPFFLYLAPGAAHAPLHVPKPWVDRFQGKFDMGWDAYRQEVIDRQKMMGIIPADTAVTARPDEIAAWSSLGPPTRRLLSRQMEVYAAFLAHADHEIGRLIEAVRKAPGGENTIIVYIVGDNGASAEGGPVGNDSSVAYYHGMAPRPVADQLADIDRLGSAEIDNHYAYGWAWATNAPFPWFKQNASHLGGTRNPLIIAYPGHMPAGGIRRQFAHVTDIVPTIYDLADIVPPATIDGVEQATFDGVSLQYSFRDEEAPTRHPTQYFEIYGNRAIYDHGWLASARHARPWDFGRRPRPIEDDVWELYDLRSDFGQARDLAGQQPQKLRELKALFLAEAGRNQVLPMLPGFGAAAKTPAGQGYSLPVSLARLPSKSIPYFDGSYRVKMRISVRGGRTEGVLLANGGRFGGFSLFVRNGRLVYCHNVHGRIIEHIVSDQRLPFGEIEVEYRFQRDPAPGRGGTGGLFIDGKAVGERHFDAIAYPSEFDSFDAGRDLGSPVSDRYPSPFPFTGAMISLDVWVD